MNMHRRRSLKSLVKVHRKPIAFSLLGLLFCLLWTLGAAVWPGLRVTPGPSAITSTLTTLATISAASVILALTAALIGLQMLSRYGSRASRMVMDRPVGLLIATAAILGVAFPLWAAAESWTWLSILGFTSFSWSLFALGFASYLTLSRLRPEWLALHMISQEFPLPSSSTDALFLGLGRMQSTLLEIAAGTDQAEPGWNVTLRAIALVGLARHRIDNKNSDLLKVVDTLTEWTQSRGTTKGPPEETASLLSLLALSSDDNDVSVAVVRAIHELIQDAIQQHQPVRRSLLDECAGLVTDRLHVLLDPAAIDWLVAQKPVEQKHGLVLDIPDGQVVNAKIANGNTEVAVPDHVNLEIVREWLVTPSAPRRNEWKVLSALVPVYKQENEWEPEIEPSAVEIVDPIMLPYGRSGSDQARESSNSKIDSSLLVTDEPRSPEDLALTIRTRHRHYDAYDLLEEGVALLVSACAAPTPDDTTWPGGWRGVNALQDDIQRLSSISLSLYEAGLYPPTDRVERAIETIGSRVIRGQKSEAHYDELSSVTGWRTRETALEHTTAHSATEALRKLAIESWQAGFGRRSLLTIRRLVSIITVVIQSGDPRLLEDLDEDLRLSVIRTAKWTDNHLAEQERSRQLVLSIAPELMALGQAAQPQTSDELWKEVFDTLDTIAWSPAGSEIEVATDIYLYFLSGTEAANPLDAGQPWDVVSWDRRPMGQSRELLPQVREHLLHQLRFDASSSQPGIAIFAVLALWRDVLIRDDRQALETFQHALTEHVLDRGRRDFEPPILWSSSSGIFESAPRFEGPRIHWRLFDVASAAHRWSSTKLDTGVSTPAVLPPVMTPDGDLRSLITTFGAEKLVNERQYWGVEYGEDCFILIEEADQSRRLLRDCEGKARTQFTWGYGGTGPDNLGAALVADMLETFIYCPSCFGAVAAGGGLVECPSCDGDGLRRNDLWALHRACNHVTAGLSRQIDPAVHDSVSAPTGAQWQITRTDFLQHAFRIVDELDAEDASDSRDPDVE